MSTDQPRRARAHAGGAARTERRRARVPRPGLTALTVIALVAVPAVAGATHVFDDVADGSSHAAGIEYVDATGITSGCETDLYCPGDEVTRAQMGTFLYRASGNDPATPPSVNAAELEGNSAAEVADMAGGPASLVGDDGHLAYVWANDPTSASYTPSTTYSHNPAGGITISRDGTGDYTVLFDGLSLSGGHVQVSAYGGSATSCKVASWGSNQVNVDCYAFDGSPADSRYNVLVLD